MEMVTESTYVLANAHPVWPNAGPTSKPRWRYKTSRTVNIHDSVNQIQDLANRPSKSLPNRQEISIHVTRDQRILLLLTNDIEQDGMARRFRI